MENVIDKLKSLFETKRKESIAGLVVIALVLIFGIKKLTTDPLDGTYEILTKRDHLIMVIKGNTGTVVSEDSDGDKEQRLVKIDKQKKELIITDTKGRELGKTKYMLKDKELYLQDGDYSYIKEEALEWEEDRPPNVGILSSQYELFQCTAFAEKENSFYHYQTLSAEEPLYLLPHYYLRESFLILFRRLFHQI